MNINPVLRNESKLSARSPKFTIMLCIYISILTAGVLLFYSNYSGAVYSNGLDLQGSVFLYYTMAIAQAALLMFIVPALSSTAICSEREKQTLDMLLSSKLTPIQIIIGKLSASSTKIIMLIICTMPMYTVCGLVGGVKLVNIVELILFFIVSTIFVGSMGVFISTYIKTSKVATALTYGLVLFVFIGTIIISFILLGIATSKNRGTTQPEISWLIYASPLTGFINMLSNQIGMSTQGGMIPMFGFSSMGIAKNATFISIALQLSSSVAFIYLAARKLNPLNKEKLFNLKRIRKIGVKK